MPLRVVYTPFAIAFCQYNLVIVG